MAVRGPKLCPVTDLPRLACGCGACKGYTPTDQERRDFLACGYQRDPLPPMWVKRLTYRSAEWTEEEPKRIVCDHARPPGMTICEDCAAHFAAILTDIPAVLTELNIALTKQAQFAEHGIRKRDPEESETPWDEAASKAIRRLFAALGGRPAKVAAALLDDWPATMRRPDLEQLVSRVSSAVARVHHLIDTPAVMTYYGPCPTCGRDIYQRDQHDDASVIRCRSCRYEAPRAMHLRRQLESMADKQMTLGGIVRTFNDAGVKVTRQQIENMIYREGLPREQVELPPRWVGQGDDRRLVKAEKVWMYRIGDVSRWLDARTRDREDLSPNRQRA